MIAVRYIVLLLLVLGLQTASAAAEDAQWQSFDSLGSVDHALADAALADMFGDDPELWPDWLDPRAVLIPAGREGFLLVVREPYRAPCGQFLFTVFGPASVEGARNRLGPGFCAGDLAVAPVRGQSWPDLLFSEGHQQDPADGLWHRLDQRVRWTGTEWVEIVKR
jgi:hypothetical protein